MSNDVSGKPMTGLEKFNVVVAIFVSLATALIGWKTFELNQKASENNIQLKEIERRLAEQRFGFERTRDIYDRAERYLASEQDEKRGRILVVLISSLPQSQLRADLLSIVTVEAAKEPVRVAAAENYVDNAFPEVPENLAFFGVPAFKAVDDGISFETISEFGFKDSKGTIWTVPVGTISDGASIPRVLWSVLGDPFTGKYRDAAVLHDYYSSERSRPYEDVNRMFYEAMIASGVSKGTAKTLYAAVLSFGPRWPTSGE